MKHFVLNESGDFAIQSYNYDGINVTFLKLKGGVPVTFSKAILVKYILVNSFFILYNTSNKQTFTDFHLEGNID